MPWKRADLRKSKIAFALKQAETGTRIDEICRKMGISDATFYKWRQKYGGLGLSELRKLKQLEEEKSKLKLKRIVADLSLDKAMVESFNGRLRQEFLNEHWFMSLQDARNKIEAWRGFYNEERPHSALDWQTPKKFALKNGSKPCIQNNK